MTNPCESKPCYNGGTCIQQDINSYTCACPASFGGARCKRNLVGACASNPCLRDGICVSLGSNGIFFSFYFFQKIVMTFEIEK